MKPDGKKLPDTGRRSKSRKAAAWPPTITLLLLFGALVLLAWLRGRLVDQEQAMVEGTVRIFEELAVLGRPESRSLSFQEVESLSRGLEADPVRRLFVTKLVLDGGETREALVVPFHLELTNPDWREETDWQRLPVGRGPDGFLYLDLDRRNIRAVNWAIGAFSFLLIGGLTTLSLRQFRKERQVSQLTGELEARKQEILQLERLALAGQLSANIFHDIKKPVLNIKHEAADFLDGVGEPPEKVLRSIREQTELFLTMLRDLGMESFVRSSAEEAEWCDLEEIIHRSLNLVRYEQRDVEIHVDMPGEQPLFLYAMPYRLVQLFSNLALNAFQAMEGRGELWIEGRVEDDRIAITIEDSGPGIPPEKREELFTPFVTTRSEQGGSGLGLYICRTIVEDMEGEIRIETGGRTGGARFVIEMPKGKMEG